MSWFFLFYAPESLLNRRDPSMTVFFNRIQWQAIPHSLEVWVRCFWGAWKLFVMVSWLFGMGSLHCFAHPAQVHVKILVLVCEYADTEVPVISSRQWADELNLGINTLYATATHRTAPEFEYIPVPGTLVFDFPYSDSETGDVGGEARTHDAGIIDREGWLAMLHARKTVPEYFSESVYILAVVNRLKDGRARGLFDFPLPEPELGNKVNASISVVSDPLAPFRAFAVSQESDAELDDDDGDGLSNEREILLGTRTDQSDSDEDGFSDWAEVSLGLSDPLNAVSKISLPDKTISNIAHLLGHQLGLPGLHQDERYVAHAAFEYWDLMSLDNSQGLSAISRFHTKWYDTNFGELVVDVGPGGLQEPLFYLVEPSFLFLGQFLPPGVFEMVRIRRPSLPDVFLEARPKYAVDASRVAEGFSRLGDVSGLPARYQPGVLVSRLHPGYDGGAFPYPGFYQTPIADVLLHEEPVEEGSVPSTSDDVSLAVGNATIQERQVFRDEHGLEIAIDSFDPFEGSYEITVRSDPPPRFSDLSIKEAWLDSSGNGFGTFTFGMEEGSGRPKWGGDPVLTRQRPEFLWVDSKPEVKLPTAALTHRVIFRVRNDGTEPATNIHGMIYVLPAFTLPIGDSQFDPTVLANLAQAQQQVSVQHLAPEATTLVSMECFPEGPIQAVLLLEQDSNETATHNNMHRAVFWTEYADLDTFYPPIEQTVQFYNGLPFRHHVVTHLTDIPEGWQEMVTDPDSGVPTWSAWMNQAESQAFHLRLEPPQPRDIAAGTVEQMRLRTWVDYADTDVPAGELPLTVILSQPPQLDLNVIPGVSGVSVNGSLAHGDKASANLMPLSDATVTVEVVGSDGRLQTYSVMTSQTGEFSVKVPNEPRTRYAALASFAGTQVFGPTHSMHVEWGEPGAPPVTDQPAFAISSVRALEEGRVRLEISLDHAAPVTVALLMSSDLKDWQALEQQSIPVGASEWDVPFGPEHRIAFFQLRLVTPE